MKEANDRQRSWLTNRVRWALIDPTLPAGIHQPKLTGDIGWDLEAMHDVTINPMEAIDVPVNCQIELPHGHYADIRNRSSMGRRGLYVDTNLIDTGYRGLLFVLIRNMRSHCVTTINAGDRIAQLVFHQVSPVWLEEVGAISTATARASNGLGHTGR